MIKQIKYFQAVARYNSFTEAAAEFFISQSAISQQVQALEKELGFKLLERKNRKFSLTPAGEYFYQKSLVLIADYERLCRKAAKIDGGEASLCLGFLRSFSGGETKRAVEEFAAQYPAVSVRIKHGNHEELYHLVRTGEADVVLNDLRRAFSSAYFNLTLAEIDSRIELAARSPLAVLPEISLDELKNTPCVIVAAPKERETEEKYYREIIGHHGDFLFAENIEEARLLVISNRGFLPVEDSGRDGALDQSVVRLPLRRGGEPIKRLYCAFWRRANSNPYAAKFAEILKRQFAE